MRRHKTVINGNIGAALLVVTMIATACGGTSSAVTTETTLGATTDPDESSLAFLGDLPQERAAAVVQTVDAQGGSLGLDEGVMVLAPAGAFGEAVDLTAQAFDLELDPYFDEAPWARAYVVSTVDEIELGTPVIIEIPRPAAGMRAVQLIDGEIQTVEVVGTDTARIEIPHFSEVVTMVIEAFDQQRAQQSAPDQGVADASFLTACLVAVSSILGGSALPDPGFESDPVDVEFADQLAMSMCTNALIRRAAPGGKHVSTACVGDRIGGAVNFRDAVALCAEDQNDNESADDQNDAGSDEDDNAAAEGGSPAVALIDGTYIGENGYIWVYSDFEVINDEVRVEVRDGAVTDFGFDRDWFKYIALSSASPDWYDGAVCEYDAYVRWVNAGPAIRETEVDEATGTVSIVYRQPGQLDHVIEFPDCPREFVPVSRQDDGTDDVAPVVGWALIRQEGPSVSVELHTEAGPWGIELVLPAS